MIPSLFIGRAGSECTRLVEKEEEQPKKKRILGLKFSQIIRIYGDWIDD